MKPPLVAILIVATILGGLTAYFGGQAIRRTSLGAISRGEAKEEVQWLRREFALGDADFAKVEALHLAYVPRCDALCMAVTDSGRRVAELAAATPVMTEALAAAIEADERVRGECRKALLGHLYETAAAMPPDAGKRFLEMALPNVLIAGHPNVHDSVRR